MLTTLLQMQSTFVFARSASCSWAAALESRFPKEKRGAELLGSPALKRTCLEVEFCNQLHNACVVCKGLCRIIECAAVHTDETGDTGVADRIHGVNTARNELGVVEDVERLSGELHVRSLARVKTLHNSHIPVVRARGSQRIASGSGKSAGPGLDVLGIRILGNITNCVACSVLKSSHCSSGARYAGGVDDRAELQ